MLIHEIMSEPMYTAKTISTVQFAAEMMATHNVGALPVTDDGKVIGIVTDRDIVLRSLAEGLSPAETAVHRIMTPNPITLGPQANVEDAARIFANTRIRRLPIIEDGRPIGMVTVDDVARLWDNDQATLVMVRRVAPRQKQHPPAA